MARGRHSGPRWVWYKDGSRSPPGVLSSGRWRQLLRGKGPDIFIENGRRNPITGQAYRLPVYGWERLAGNLDPWLNQVRSPPWARSHDRMDYDHRREKYYDRPRRDAVSKVYENDNGAPRAFRDRFGDPFPIDVQDELGLLEFEDIIDQHDIDFLDFLTIRELDGDPFILGQFLGVQGLRDDQLDDLEEKRLLEADDLD